jgi:hypothetical protein
MECLLSFLQNYLYFSSLSKNIKVEIYRKIFSSFLYGSGAWSLILIGEHRLRELQNRVLRKILWPKA